MRDRKNPPYISFRFLLSLKTAGAKFLRWLADNDLRMQLQLH